MEFEKISKVSIQFEMLGRRVGDVATLICDPALANKELNWKAEKGIEIMCE